MSFALDVNVLLYASDEESRLHDAAKRLLERCVSGREVFCLAWVTIMSYLRMATHASVFARPLSHEDAARNVESLIRVPQARVLAEEDGFWPIYREIARDVPARGNTIPDAHLAALLRQHGVRVLWTSDRDFLKYRFLEVHDPAKLA